MCGVWAELYDTPWEDEPRHVWFCSDECEDAYCNSGSFEYILCEGCYRKVCEQNPRNVWHLQFRDHPELGYICLRCYQDEILKNGQPRSDFEDDKIRGGMFFSYGNLEPKKVGFEEVQGFTNYFVRDAYSIRRYNSQALKRIDNGQKVGTAFERIGLWLEGYITMMSKPTTR